MTTPIKILGISGSLRRGSHNTALLRAAADLAPLGAQVELYDELGVLPPYNEDHDGDDRDPSAERLRDAIAQADGVLFATPEYNGTIPGQLKNAIDWASRPRGQSVLADKPVAVIGASAGQHGAIWAQNDLRRALGIAGARVVEAPNVAVSRSHEHLDANGVLVDAGTRERIEALVAELAEEAWAVPVAA